MNQISQRFPRIFMIYNQFKNGSVQLMKDAKTRATLAPKAGTIYTPEELIAHHQFTSDVARCLPVFVVFWIPFVGMWLALPVAFFFPTQTLSRQFWTESQRVAALDKALLNRMSIYPALTDKLLTSIDKSKVDHKVAQLSSDIIEKISSGGVFHEPEAKVLRRLFSEANNLHTGRMPMGHERYLAASWGRGPMVDMHSSAVHLVNVDDSLKHFQVKSQPKYILDMVCYQRGLPLENRSNEECVRYINHWLSLAKGKFSHGGELGYLLHLPMFMRNNWQKETSEPSNSKKTSPD